MAPVLVPSRVCHIHRIETSDCEPANREFDQVAISGMRVRLRRAGGPLRSGIDLRVLARQAQGCATFSGSSYLPKNPPHICSPVFILSFKIPQISSLPIYRGTAPDASDQLNPHETKPC